MNPAEWLARTARITPEAPALLKGTTVVADYATFAKRAAAIGGALRHSISVQPGDRVAVFMTNRTEYLEALYGIWFCGAVAVPINAKLHAKEAAWIIADSGADVLFTSDDVWQELAGVLPSSVRTSICADKPEFSKLYNSTQLEHPADIKPDDMIWLFYTSGTTGKPKGVMITSLNIQTMTFTYFVDVDEVSKDDAILYAAPMSHGAGIYNFMHILRGARHVVPMSGGFNASEILDLEPKIQNVSLFAAPTMVKRLVDQASAEGSTGEGLKTISYAGGPMYLADIMQAVDVMGSRFVQVYGQGECPMAITALPRNLVVDRRHPNWKSRLASVGIAQSSVYVRIVGEDGEELPVGEIGEIAVQGLPVMKGYWNNAEATAKTIKDGWLWTGDMGAIDEDGFITLHDRSKDMIISGGSNIYPREVEESLLQHPSVTEVAVVGRKHDEWGESVVAFVVSTEGSDRNSKELDNHCLNEIARFKRPKEYRFIKELPKNNYGKVLKTDLRNMLENEE